RRAVIAHDDLLVEAEPLGVDRRDPPDDLADGGLFLVGGDDDGEQHGGPGRYHFRAHAAKDAGTLHGLLRTFFARYGFAAALAFLYVYSFPYFAETRHANELPRAYLTRAMVDDGTFAIDSGVRRWGSTADVSPYG